MRTGRFATLARTLALSALTGCGAAATSSSAKPPPPIGNHGEASTELDVRGKALMVTALEPTQGDAEGGQVVTVEGNRFQMDGARSVKVYFGGIRSIVRGFRSDSELTVIAPPGKAGSVVDVELEFEPGGYLKMEKAFRYLETTQGLTPGVETTP